MIPIWLSVVIILVGPVYVLWYKHRSSRKTEVQKAYEQEKHRMWLMKNSPLAILYKGMLCILFLGTIGHVLMSTIDMKDSTRKMKNYRNTVTVIDTKMLSDHRLELEIYNGLNETIEIKAVSNQPETLFVEESDGIKWKRIQTPSTQTHTTTLESNQSYYPKFRFTNQIDNIRLGISWKSLKTNLSGIAWSQK